MPPYSQFLCLSDYGICAFGGAVVQTARSPDQPRHCTESDPPRQGFETQDLSNESGMWCEPIGSSSTTTTSPPLVRMIEVAVSSILTRCWGISPSIGSRENPSPLSWIPPVAGGAVAISFAFIAVTRLISVSTTNLRKCS